MEKALPRRERDRKLRESDILQAAEEVFATQGYHKATIADIARKAQYAVGTVYLYFKNKQILYYRLFEERWEEMTRAISEEVDRTQGSLEKLTTIVKARLRFFDENRDFFRIYFTERNVDKGVMKDRLKEIIEKKYVHHTNMLIRLMKKAIEEGRLRKLNPEKLAFAFIGNINAMIFSSLILKRKDEPLLKDKDFIIDLFLNGAANQRRIITNINSGN